MSSNPNLASLIIPRNIRHPVLVVLVLIVIVFALHAFIRVPFNGSLGRGRSRSRDEIGMLTYNIWFSTEKMRERMEALGQIVEDLQPDILVFQEVTRENLAILEEQTTLDSFRCQDAGETSPFCDNSNRICCRKMVHSSIRQFSTHAKACRSTN